MKFQTFSPFALFCFLLGLIQLCNWHTLCPVLSGSERPEAPPTPVSDFVTFADCSTNRREIRKGVRLPIGWRCGTARKKPLLTLLLKTIGRPEPLIRTLFSILKSDKPSIYDRNFGYFKEVLRNFYEKILRANQFIRLLKT